MKPRVVVDLFKLRTPYSGLGQFCRRLGRSLIEQSSDIELRCWLRPKDHPTLGVSEAKTLDAVAWRKERLYRWVRPLLRRLPIEGRIDLWHATDQYFKHLPADPRVPVVLTVHDLNFLREKHKATTDRKLAGLQRAVDRATAVTTISEFVAGEMREYLDLRGKPIRVIYNGADPAESNSPQCRPDWMPDGEYLFTIGAVVPKKNFHVLVPMMSRVPGLRLVIAGPDHHAYAGRIRQDAVQLGLEDRVIVSGEVSDAERTWLYANCSAFCFPSLTEGFGLPVIEAMQHGRPVFCSRRTSLPEVAGPHANYWDADDADHLATVFNEGMRQVAADPLLGERLRRHAATFDWDDTARQYLGVYRETLGVVNESEKRAA